MEESYDCTAHDRRHTKNHRRTICLAYRKGVGIEHRTVLQLIRKFSKDFEEVGPIAFEMRMGKALPPMG